MLSYYYNIMTFLVELLKRFPLWDQLHGVFGDRTASRPLSTSYNGQDDDASEILFGGGEEDEERPTSKASQHSESSEEDVASSSKKVLIRGKTRGKKRTFSESLVDIASEREEGRMKRSVDMLNFLREKHEEKMALLIEQEKTAREKAKSEKLVAKNNLLTKMLEAGFSKEEIQEQLKDE